MKKYLFALTLGASAAFAQNAVSPAALSDWRITGAEPAGLFNGTTLVLPAGAELVRVFPEASLLLHGVSTPQFTTAAADCAVLQVGPATLAMIRQGDEGRVLLLVDDTASLLPLKVALDEEGRSREPLDLAVAYDPSIQGGVVAWADQVKPFQSRTQGQNLEVAVMAGKNAAWSHEFLSVHLLVAEAGSAATASGQGQDGAPGSSRFSEAVERALRAMERNWAAAEARGSGGANASAGPSDGAARAVTLEVFTPPAVRRGRAAIQAELARLQQR